MAVRLFAGIAALAFVLTSASADAQMRITEWLYSGASGEYIEFTNIGLLPIDMTGWSYSDSATPAGTVDLSAFGIVGAGESVILTEEIAATFDAAWGLGGLVSIIGGNTTNLGRNDQINLWDDLDGLIDRLTYGDQNFPGTIRAQDRSGNPITPAALGADDPSQWELAINGDGHGSYLSSGGDLGNPGVHIVPEPATLILAGLGLGGISMVRRRRI